MQVNDPKKPSYVSVHRQKFIIPQLDKNVLSSNNLPYQTAYLNSASFKRNLLFASTKQKSFSQQKKVTTDPNLMQKKEQTKISKHKKVDRNTSSFGKQNGENERKFKVINNQVQQSFTWQKWKKRNINVAGKNFIMALNSKIQKQAVTPEIEEKQNIQIFKLRHKIRELHSLKETVKVTKQNNELIRNLEMESNQKIRQFFGKYEQMVQDIIR